MELEVKDVARLLCRDAGCYTDPFRLFDGGPQITAARSARSRARSAISVSSHFSLRR